MTDKHTATRGFITLIAGDGTRHKTARSTLSSCPYFTAGIERWETEEFELDMDNASLKVILTLLRYGPQAVPELEDHIRAMVLKDADYLGVPPELWAHLVDADAGPGTGKAEAKPAEPAELDDPDEDTDVDGTDAAIKRAKREARREGRAVLCWEARANPHFNTCVRCRQYGARTVWTCTVCKQRHASDAKLYSPSNATLGSQNFRIARCRQCGEFEYASSRVECVVCRTGAAERSD